MKNVVLYMCGGEKPISEVPLGIGYLLSNTTGANVVYTTDWGNMQGADIAGFSSNAWGLGQAFDIARRLRVTSPRTRRILGGQGTLWRGLDSFANHPFDNVIRGDGERALQSIVMGRVPMGTVIEKRIVDINSIKPPVRGKCGASVPIITSRGCPFNCHFCTSRAQWGKPRLRSVDNIANEISVIRYEYPHMKELYILDDLWAYPEARFEDFYDWWMKHDLNKQLTLRGFVRSGMVTKDLLVKMKKMGFTRVRFGAETASPRLLKTLNKGCTVEDHQRAIDLAFEVGLPITGSFMHGLPGETKKDLQLTSQFLQKNKGKFKREGWYRFKAFPGCKLYGEQDPTKHDMRVR